MTWRNNPSAVWEDGKDGTSSLPAFIIDAAAGVIVAANSAARLAWGLEGHDSLPPAAIDRAMPALRRLACLDRTGDSEELAFWAPGGLLRLRCRVESLPGASGTYLVRALPAPRCDGAHTADAKSPARSATRLAGAGAVRTSALARLAHEVRTPLSAAIAYAEVLKEEHFGPLANGRYREYVRNIYDSARHALSVVDGMLANEPGSPGPSEFAFRDLDPAGVIDNCLAVTRPLAERAGLHLVAVLGPRTPRVIADEVSLKQMLLNLITNAIKFARPGDRVTLGTDYAADGCLRIEVADTGPGMAASAHATGASPAKGHAGVGLGIGLPLTRALAEANGAALIVDSAPGRGTRVTIAFSKDRVVPI